MKKITIAIDGFSSTGKSTIAKQIARKLNYIYVDSGAMYRAITLFAIQHDLIGTGFFKKEELIARLDNIHLQFFLNKDDGKAEMHLNDTNVEYEIRTLEVSQFVSKVAAVSEVRKKLVKQQRSMGKDKGVVMDGRDIGTVVFPKADLKLFLTASADKRAKRRYKELIDRGDEGVTYDRVLKNVEARDHIDATREDSPLVRAEDAVLIDNSDMGLNEQFERIFSLVTPKLNQA